MSEAQLREAYALMKQGEKTKAKQVVQEVLREDTTNLNAWWLLSHLLSDEAEIVKALENVLALNPEHPGARKRLSELRPEYAHLYEPATAEKVKTDKANKANWNKLYTPPKPQKRKSSWAVLNTYIVKKVGFALVFTLIMMSGIIFNGFNRNNEKPAVNPSSPNGWVETRVENSPLEVAKAFNEAYFREDGNALYALSCEAYHSEIDAIVAEFDSPNPARITVDYSETEFLLDKESNEQHAYVSFHGSTFIQNGGMSLQTDWDALAEANGYDYYGFELEKIDGYWKVCIR